MRSAIDPRFALVLAAIGLGGCGSYTSDYRPPNDGRARVLFHDTTAVASIPETSEACLEALDAPPPAPMVRVRRGGGSGVFVYWSPVVHVRVSGGGSAAGAAHGSRALAAPSVRSGSSFGGHSSGAGKPGSGSSNSGGGDLGKVAIVAVAVAVVVLPALTLGLALTPTISEDESAKAIDRVNIYNDLARTPGSPCADPSLFADPGDPEGPGDPPPAAPEAPPEEP